MENKIQDDPIGKTSSPLREPNTTYKFHFWMKPGTRLNPLDFVVAEQVDGSRTLGQVQEIFAYTDADSHLTNYIGSEFGNPNVESYSERLSTMVGKAQVVRNLRTDGKEELYMPLPADRRIFFATESDIQASLEFDRTKGVPAGVIEQSSGLTLPVYVPPEFIVGPEGAHANATGISGLATKTSYLMFLISALYQKAEDVSIIIFNVKHSDLLHIHEENIELSAAEQAIYDSFGLQSNPFKDVTYFLPHGQGDGPDSDTPPDTYEVYAYSFDKVHDELELLFADVGDEYHTISAFTRYVANPDHWDSAGNGVIFEGSLKQTGEFKEVVCTWKELLDLDDDYMRIAVYNDPRHSTPPRLKRELHRLTYHPMFVGRLSDTEVNLRHAAIECLKKPGQVCVIDIFNLKPFTQAFVIGDVIKGLEDLYQNPEETKPPHLVIFIDELNKFAPTVSIGEQMNPVTEKIIYVTSQGRSRGTALFGAEQFKSQVHKQVWGNCSLHIIGRTGNAELRTAAYGELDDSAKNVVMNLKKGEMLLSFANWPSPVKITFPRPSYIRARDND